MEDRLSMNSEIAMTTADGTLSGHSSGTNHVETHIPQLISTDLRIFVSMEGNTMKGK